MKRRNRETIHCTVTVWIRSCRQNKKRKEDKNETDCKEDNGICKEK